MLKKISLTLTKYKVLKQKIDEKINVKQTITATLGTILINLVIFLIPMLLLYNLMIFDQIIWLLKIIVFVLIFLFSFSYNIFFVKIIKNYNENLEKNDFKYLIIFESTIIFLVLSMFAAVIMVLV
jgi:tellurite resistance protein TehA-like permease